MFGLLICAEDPDVSVRDGRILLIARSDGALPFYRVWARSGALAGVYR